MTKVDKLLQKINVYEKLALFGNRKNFLTAIAQEVKIVFPPSNMSDALKSVEAKLQSTVRLVTEQLPQSRSDLSNLQIALNTLGNLMQQAYVTSFSDLKAKARALGNQLMNVKTSTYQLSKEPELKTELKSYLVQLSGEASSVYDLMLNDPTVAKVMQTQTDNESPVAQHTVPSHTTTTNTIPKDVQEKLSEMLSVRGDYFPFQVGDSAKAQKALDIFKKNYNSSQLSGESLYNEVRKSYNIWQMSETSNNSKTPTTPLNR